MPFHPQKIYTDYWTNQCSDFVEKRSENSQLCNLDFIESGCKPLLKVGCGRSTSVNEGLLDDCCCPKPSLVSAVLAALPTLCNPVTAGKF
jgi:hypothetical protein